LDEVIFLLDTDSLVFLVRGLKANAKDGPRRRALRIMNKCEAAHRAGDPVAVSAITLSEIEYGARCGSEYEAEMAATRKVLTPFAIIDFTALDCPTHYGQVRHDLKVAGTPIGAMDQLIAAHALALDATLVTNNVADFRRVKNLRVVNWS
jgi:tRNA(fMet)-specific endonuclease VapC